MNRNVATNVYFTQLSGFAFKKNKYRDCMKKYILRLQFYLKNYDVLIK